MQHTAQSRPSLQVIRGALHPQELASTIAAATADAGKSPRSKKALSKNKTLAQMQQQRLDFKAILPHTHGEALQIMAGHFWEMWDMYARLDEKRTEREARLLEQMKKENRTPFRPGT